MTDAKSQKKWRDKHHFVKSQLNVMARKSVHKELEEIAQSYDLRGKGEAVSFAVFLTQALIQRAEYNSQAAVILDDFSEAFHRNRDLYTN